MLWFWWNSRHWLRCKFFVSHLWLQPVMKISLKWHIDLSDESHPDICKCAPTVAAAMQTHTDILSKGMISMIYKLNNAWYRQSLYLAPYCVLKSRWCNRLCWYTSHLHREYFWYIYIYIWTIFHPNPIFTFYVWSHGLIYQMPSPYPQNYNSPQGLTLPISNYWT